MWDSMHSPNAHNPFYEKQVMEKDKNTFLEEDKKKKPFWIFETHKNPTYSKVEIKFFIYGVAVIWDRKSYHL